MLDAENGRRRERVNCLRREKMAEVKAKERLKAELERTRTVCTNTARAAQQVGLVSTVTLPLLPTIFRRYH